MNKKRYVIGFLFDNDKVALIRKSRPDWQKGKLNGIGGHIENNETPLDAMQREFKEEAWSEPSWEWYCTMVFDEALVYCFRSFQGLRIFTMTDEEVGWFPIDNLPDNIIPNLHWLIPLARCDDNYMKRIETSNIE